MIFAVHYEQLFLLEEHKEQTKEVEDASKKYVGRHPLVKQKLQILIFVHRVQATQ